jgi:P27 family predicted phage terminase small subunit
MPNPPIPFELAKLRGFPGKRRLTPEPQPEVAPAPPPPPSWLSPHARDEWLRVVPSLHALRLLTVLDTVPLAAYCESYATWRDAVEVLGRLAGQDDIMHGLLIKTPDGPKPNPLTKIASCAASDMLRAAAEFGLTPVARARISRGPGWQPPGDSKFDGLLG